MKLDPILSLAFTMYSGKGVYALLLGSGTSKSAGIPTGWDVVVDLVKRLAQLQGEDCGAQPEIWFRDKFGNEADYSELLNTLGPTPSQRQQILRDYFEPNESERERGLKEPTKAHRAIAKLVAQGFIRVILTTNFDRLIERAIADEGISPVVISSPEGLTGSLPLAHQRCTIIKLHGDYQDTRIKNTDKELELYEPAIDEMLDQVLDEYGLIVAGWSGEWDAALRKAIERCPNRRFGFYWTSKSEPGEVAKRLVNLRGGSIIQITDADSFFADLATKLDVLSNPGADHPLNASMAVAMVKRYAAKPEFEIPLHDLLFNEAETVFQETDRIYQKWKINSDPKTIRRLMEELAGNASKLRRMVGHAAYWSGESLIPVISKCVAKLAQEPLPPRQGGSLRHNWLRIYLGGMIMYAAGVGFVAAGKFTMAAKMLEDVYSDGPNRRERFIIEFTYNIHHIRDCLNQNSSEYVPFSELMFIRMKEELDALSSSPRAFESAFDEYELLMAFIFGEIISAKLDKEGYVHLTPGRYVYLLRNSQISSPLFPPMGSQDSVELCMAQKPFKMLIDAGYFGGKWERIVDLRAIMQIVAFRYVIA